jgi:L-amino acid N-acyltransferase YncA
MISTVIIRRGTTDDASSIVAVWQAIVAEKSYSAIERPFTLGQEREYLKSLSAREGVFLAETAERQVVGFQSLDQWTKLFHSMDHVGQLGTFVVREWRRHGIGKQLAAQTLDIRTVWRLRKAGHLRARKQRRCTGVLRRSRLCPMRSSRAAGEDRWPA